MTGHDLGRPAGRRRTAVLAAAGLAGLALLVPALPALGGQAASGPSNHSERQYNVPATQPEGIVYDDRTQAF